MNAGEWTGMAWPQNHEGGVKFQVQQLYEIIYIYIYIYIYIMQRKCIFPTCKL